MTPEEYYNRESKSYNLITAGVCFIAIFVIALLATLL